MKATESSGLKSAGQFGPLQIPVGILIIFS